jgi:hypothetical protein
MAYRERVMETTHLEHPTAEALERFLLDQVSEKEAEVIGAHFLGCPLCCAAPRNP